MFRTKAVQFLCLFGKCTCRLPLLCIQKFCFNFTTSIFIFLFVLFCFVLFDNICQFWKHKKCSATKFGNLPLSQRFPVAKGRFLIYWVVFTTPKRWPKWVSDLIWVHYISICLPFVVALKWILCFRFRFYPFFCSLFYYLLYYYSFWLDLFYICM